MEDSPEEILARLQRYVDSLKARGDFVAARAASPEPAVAAESRRVTVGVLTDDRPAVRRSFGTLIRTIAGQLICVATCVATIVLWINIAGVVAYVAALVAAVLLGIGMARRVPFTGWALIGLAVGLLLGRFS